MIKYSNTGELIIISLTLGCYLNSYIMNALVFRPDHIFGILLLNLVYFRSLTALYTANQTHKFVYKQLKSKQIDNQYDKKKQQNIQYCRHCECYIQNRDHHCIFVGRCVQKQNYQYFFSFVVFSYCLSLYGLFQFYLNYDFIVMCFKHYQKYYLIHLVVSFVSHVYFIIFTGALLAGSLRSIIQGTELFYYQVFMLLIKLKKEKLLKELIDNLQNFSSQQLESKLYIVILSRIGIQWLVNKLELVIFFFGCEKKQQSQKNHCILFVLYYHSFCYINKYIIILLQNLS